MAKCSILDNWVGCQLENQIGNAVDSGAENLGEVMMGSYDSITKAFLTSWLNVGLLVDLDAGSVTWLTAQLGVISVLLATVGIMIAAIWTMVHHRGEKAVKVAKSMFTVVLVSTAGVGLMQVVLVGGDAFSDWILESAGVTVDTRAQLPVAGIVAGSPGLAILGGIFGIIATIIQWGIMLVRSALLPLLVGVWPVTAAASMIGGAEQAFSKITTWIIAFTLYKPVAAIIYAYAWKTKSGDDGMGGVINGLVLIVLAVVALPAMMRLLAPGTSALGGSGGGGMALAGGAAMVGAGVAAGTAVLSGGGSAAAGGAAKTAGTAKSTQSATSTAKGTGDSGPPSTGDSGSGGGSPAGGSGSGGTGSGTVGGDSTAGGTGSETVGADGAASGAGGTGAGTVGGDSAAGGTGAETVGADGAASGTGGTGAETVGADTAAQGASQPTNAETGGSGPAAGGTATSGTSSGPGGDSAGVGTPAPGTSEPVSADAGTTGSSESAGPSGSAGTAAGTGAPAGAPETTPAYPNTNNGPSKAKEAGSAAAKSMGQAIADGTKDADGKDVIGE